MPGPGVTIVRDAGCEIGETRDLGAGRVAAFYFLPKGVRVRLGLFATRREAAEAVAARHRDGRPEPPEAA